MFHSLHFSVHSNAQEHTEEPFLVIEFCFWTMTGLCINSLLHLRIRQTIYLHMACPNKQCSLQKCPFCVYTMGVFSLIKMLRSGLSSLCLFRSLSRWWRCYYSMRIHVYFPACYPVFRLYYWFGVFLRNTFFGGKRLWICDTNHLIVFRVCYR